MDYCVRCGCKLDLTNYGRKFCKNCGMLTENQDVNDEENEKRTYIG